MALSQKHRSSIYQRLSPMLGEEEAEALLSQFPSRDLDEPVTQGFVRAEIADVRAELAGMRTEIAAVEARLTEQLRQQTIWFLGALIAAMGLISAIVFALR